MRRADARSAAAPIKISYFNGRIVSIIRNELLLVCRFYNFDQISIRKVMIHDFP